MTGAMKQVGDADGSRCSGHFNPCKQRMVVHDGIGQEDFVNSAAAEIERRSVVQTAPRGNAREQPVVLTIPKSVFDGNGRLVELDRFARFRLIRGGGAGRRLRRGRRVWVSAFGRLLLRLDRAHGR